MLQAPPILSKAPKMTRQPRTLRFPIVGIGASAGGLEAFTQLLAALPVDTGMAFVLVQHLDPAHESQLAEILSPCDHSAGKDHKRRHGGRTQRCLCYSSQHRPHYRQGSAAPHASILGAGTSFADRPLVRVVSRRTRAAVNRSDSFRERLGWNPGS